MTDKTDSKEREDVELSRACVKAWDSSGFTSNPMDAVHPMFSAAFELGYRASLAANAGSEPVKRVFLVHTGEEHEGEATYTRHDDAPPPLCDSECLYTHPSPPEGMVGGWIASKDQMPPPGVRVFWGDADSNRVGYDSWAGDDYRWAPSHWMHIPEFRAPPTSSADSRKGE